MFTAGEIILIVGTTALILWLVTVQAIYVKALAAEQDHGPHGPRDDHETERTTSREPSEPPADPS